MFIVQFGGLVDTFVSIMQRLVRIFFINCKRKEQDLVVDIVYSKQSLMADNISADINHNGR